MRQASHKVEGAFSDIHRVLIQHQIPLKFSKQTERELSQIPESVKAKDKEGRRDLTGLDFITIDGVTARDFDDAIYVETTPSGFHAYIAIADVSHYVKPGMQIDLQAYERGNSTYFTDYVVHMLPEKLSNGICSLNPREERLAVVVDLELGLKGQVLAFQLYEAVIKTVARTTYEEVQSVLDGKELRHLSHIRDAIFHASQLAKVLLSQRLPDVSLDLDLPEFQLTLDESGEVRSIERAFRLFSHRMIEELMLLANVTVAQCLKAYKVPAIYRVHEKPAGEDIAVLNDFLKHLGHSTLLHVGQIKQRKINTMLKKFKGTQYEPIANIMVLRAMKQARYSHQAIGHFGLGFPDYVHFTSPIRRYSDLVVHRQLKRHFKWQNFKKALSIRDLGSMGTHLSACEQRSVKAERQVMGIQKAKFMEGRIGQQYEGIITSITRFGLFVLLTEFEVDGMIRLSDLAKGSFVFDEKNLYLQNRRTKKVFRVGDIIQVVIDRVEVSSGKVGLVLPSRVGGKRHERFHKRKKFSKKHKKCF